MMSILGEIKTKWGTAKLDKVINLKMKSKAKV